jgi:hypothetical protein
MNADRRRVEIQDHPVRRRARVPRALAGERPGLTNPFKLALADLEQHPPGCRHRREPPEQRALARQHSEV